MIIFGQMFIENHGFVAVPVTSSNNFVSLNETKFSFVSTIQVLYGADFDGVNHLGILYKLCSLGIGGSVLSILTQFLSNPSQ